MFSLTNNLNSAICNEEISVKNYGKAQLYQINSKKMRCSHGHSSDNLVAITKSHDKR